MVGQSGYALKWIQYGTRGSSSPRVTSCYLYPPFSIWVFKNRVRMLLMSNLALTYSTQQASENMVIISCDWKKQKPGPVLMLKLLVSVDYTFYSPLPQRVLLLGVRFPRSPGVMKVPFTFVDRIRLAGTKPDSGMSLLRWQKKPAFVHSIAHLTHTHWYLLCALY